jgi:hypothetical protein
MSVHICTVAEPEFQQQLIMLSDVIMRSGFVATFIKVLKAQEQQ